MLPWPILPPRPSASGPYGRAAVAGHARVRRGFLSGVVYLSPHKGGLSGTGIFQTPGPMQKVCPAEGTWWSLVLAQLFHRSQKTLASCYSPIPH